MVKFSYSLLVITYILQLNSIIWLIVDYITNSVIFLSLVGPPWRLNIKINVDAIVGHRFSAIAVVVRDWRGELVFAGSVKVNTILPLQAEAEAISWAISSAPVLASESVIVETDSQIVSHLGESSHSLIWGSFCFSPVMSL